MFSIREASRQATSSRRRGAGARRPRHSRPPRQVQRLPGRERVGIASAPPTRKDVSVTERPSPHGRPGGDSATEQLWWFRDARVSVPPVSHDRLRSIRRRRTLDVIACLSLSTLCFSQARRETLFRGDWDFYTRVPLGATVLAALVLNIVALAAIGFLGVQAIRRVRRPACRRLGAVAAAATLLISLNFARLTHETVGRWTDAIGGPGLSALVVLTLVASLAWPHVALRVS